MRRKLGLVMLTIAVGVKCFMMAGCAGIGAPTGGPRDTTAPRLVMAVPKDSAVNVNSQKLVLTFDEFVEIKDVQQNVLVSPNPSKSPIIDYKLRNITVKLRDSLEPNTTYSINFGSAIKDINEGNVFKEFTYTFSTGPTLAEGRMAGKVLLAETGKTDSTLIVVLHNNLADTAIFKNSPRYIAKIDGMGNFAFHHLAVGQYNAFVLPNDYAKKYDDSTKIFGFIDSVLTISNHTSPITFFAFQEAKRKEKPAATNANANAKPTSKEDKRLKYSTSLEGSGQDLLGNLLITFNRKLQLLDSTKIILCDTFYQPLAGTIIHSDTSNTIATLSYAWKEASDFRLIIQKDAAKDTNGMVLPKGDTIKFSTKKEVEYGSLKLKFSNLNLSEHPVLQLIANEKIQESVVLTSAILKRKLFKPGDYIVRILLDANKNGIWDAGNFKKKQQPEIVLDKNWKVNVKANWDNEKEIKL